jgi:hypothetical protein
MTRSRSSSASQSRRRRPRQLIGDAVVQVICRAIQAGASDAAAAQQSGVTEPTMKRWMTRGLRADVAVASGEEPAPTEFLYLAFVRLVEGARRSRLEAT